MVDVLRTSLELRHRRGIAMGRSVPETKTGGIFGRSPIEDIRVWAEPQLQS